MKTASLPPEWRPARTGQAHLPHRPMPSNYQHFTLRRERLPAVAEFYAGQGLALTGHGPWRSALCPFHPDTRPSLRLHLPSGAFRCMACGSKGGDVLAFYRLRHSVGFVEAAKALGAWEVLP